jgi:hypothetical protein
VKFNLTNVALVDGRCVGTTGTPGGYFPGQVASPGEDVGGAAIRNAGDVVLVDCTISNHVVIGGLGGAPSQYNTQPGAGGNGRGGAILNIGGTVHLRGCLLSGNTASGGASTYDPTPPVGGTNGFAEGGALANIGGGVTVVDCVFAANTASNQTYSGFSQWATGGALHTESGNANFTNSVFIANGAMSQSSQGVYNHSAARVAGGAVSVRSGTAMFQSSQILSNVAVGGFSRNSSPGQGFGGALFNGGNVTVLQTTFGGNSASGGGGAAPAIANGGAIYSTGVVAISASTLQNNISRGGKGRDTSNSGFNGANAFGGAIGTVGSCFVTNCTIVANSAVAGAAGGPGAWAGDAYGGAIACTGGSVVLVNTTVATNLANMPPPFGFGGASLGANLAVTNASFTLRNSLVAYAGTSVNVWGTIIDGGYNMCSDGSANISSGTSFNFTDPRLLSLANNGEPTLTMTLAADSPAIDWAPSAGAPATDQRGVLRPYGAGVDVGAFEWTPPGPALTLNRVGNTYTLSFPVAAGVPYRIESSAALPAWQLYENLGTVPTNGVVTRSITASNAWRFFRVSAY